MTEKKKKLQEFLVREYPNADENKIISLTDKLMDIIDDVNVPVHNVNDRVICFETEMNEKRSHLLNVFDELVVYFDVNESNAKRLFDFVVYEYCSMNIYIRMILNYKKYFNEEEIEKLEGVGKMFDLSWLELD